MIVIGQLVIARIENPRARRHCTGIQPGNRHRRLDGRARRVQSSQDAVEQRPVDGIAQLGIGLEADAGDKQVRIEARRTDHRQHFTGGRVQRDDRTTTPAQCGFGGFLKLDVQAQDDVLAGDRVGAFEHTQYATTGVGLDLFVANLTMQFGLVKALDTGLADMVRAAVIDRVEAPELFFVDAPHVADRVGKVRPLRVVPDQLRNHFDARQAELVDGDQGDLLFAQLEQNGHRLEWPTPLFHALFEDDAVVRGELQDLDNGVEHAGPLACTFTGHAETETGPVVGDHNAIAVVDQPTAGRNRLNVNAVVFRKRGVIVVLDDLQVIQPGNQHAHQQHHRHCTEHDPAAHQACVLFVVFEADRLRHLGRIHSKNDATCDKGARTGPSRRDTSARRSGCAPTDAAGSAATETSVVHCGHRLQAPAPRGRRPSG